jgi:SPOR domain
VRYRHVWPGLLLLAALGLLLVGLLRWGDHFLSPGPTGGIQRLLQLWAASRPSDESVAAPLRAPAISADSAATPPVSLAPMSAAPADAAPAVPTPMVPAATPTVTPLPGSPTTPQPAADPKAPAVEWADEPGNAAPSAVAPSTPAAVRYTLAVGTFAVTDDAVRVEARLNQAGFSTVRFRQQATAKLFSVQIGSLKDAEDGQATVERLQKAGYAAALVPGGRSGATVRVGEATPLRTAIQVAEKLRTAGYDAHVVAEPARAGQVSLRHGNFASRGEAEAASREIARLGVPNEVIQIR